MNRAFSLHRDQTSIPGAFLITLHCMNGAGDGIRTRDPNLGKVVLYQLSYTRNASIFTLEDALCYTKRILNSKEYYPILSIWFILI